MELWGLSNAQAAEVFGVSRQAVSKWLDAGVPLERTEAGYLVGLEDPETGIAAIIQPGGSMRDEEVIAAANERGDEIRAVPDGRDQQGEEHISYHLWHVPADLKRIAASRPGPTPRNEQPARGKL